MVQPQQSSQSQNQQQYQDLEQQKTCRICLSEETNANKFIEDYCECKGTVKNIHELCLKTYILSKTQETKTNLQDIVKNTQKCDICKAEFQVNWKSQYQFINLKQIIKNEKSILMVILAGLLLMIGCVFLMTSMRSQLEEVVNDQIKNIISVVIVVLCSISILFLLACQTYLIFKFLIVKQVSISKISKLEKSNK